jgi:hypothetical protein
MEFRRPRPARALRTAVLVGLTISLAPGCAREPQETREVRLVAERYLAALARKDFDEIRLRATCLVAAQAIQGGHVLRIDAPHRVTLGVLDSMVVSSARAHRHADSLWVRAENGDREQLFQSSRRAGRLHITYRNAVRAAALSRPDSLHDSSTLMDTRSLRVRVRYAGVLVGPKPVDREMILRLLRAPAGKWIAFSLYTLEDDPRPDGV